MNLFLIAQALGFVSFGLGISTFYQKDDRKLKILMLVFNLNHLLHYLLLGSMMSTLAAALSAVRTGTSIYVSSKRVAILFIVLGLILGLYAAEQWWTLFPIAGTAIGTYAMFATQGIRMRLYFLLGACCWLTNNIIVGSYGGVLLELTVITMNMITIFRLSKSRAKEKDQTVCQS
ncbi:YgjV family protein [Vibrio sp. HN007]|uniref:YgjV family protein n=1 Tax=Vibrio iocasae TaxID=3098914 RepID=UPI0035D40FE2